MRLTELLKVNTVLDVLPIDRSDFERQAKIDENEVGYKVGT